MAAAAAALAFGGEAYGQIWTVPGSIWTGDEVSGIKAPGWLVLVFGALLVVAAVFAVTILVGTVSIFVSGWRRRDPAAALIAIVPVGSLTVLPLLAWGLSGEAHLGAGELWLLVTFRHPMALGPSWLRVTSHAALYGIGAWVCIAVGVGATIAATRFLRRRRMLPKALVATEAVSITIISMAMLVASIAVVVWALSVPATPHLQLRYMTRFPPPSPTLGACWWVSIAMMGVATLGTGTTAASSLRLLREALR